MRLLIGDTTEANPQVQDEEVDWALTQEANVYRAGALLCDTLSAKYGAKRDKTVGSLSISYGAQHTNYMTLAKSLRRQAARKTNAGPIFTGDNTEPIFTRGMDDYVELEDPT